MTVDTAAIRAVFYTGLRLFIHSNLLISLAATGTAVSTMVLAGLSLDPLALFIVFAVTLFVYSFNRLADRAEDQRNLPKRSAFIDRYGTQLFVLGALLYLLAIGVAIVASIPGAPAMIIPLAVAVLYSVVGLKRILLVKNLLVGLAWGLIPLGVGVYYGVLWTVDILFLFAFTTVMLTIAAVVFDIKDIEGDREEGVRTIPLVAGVRETRLLAAGATGVVGAVVLLAIIAGPLGPRYGALLPFTAYVFSYSLVATEDRTVLFYGGVIDSEHIFLAVLLLLSEYGM